MVQKILFVDDEEIIHRSLKRVFENSPYKLLSANNGEEALEVAKRETPSLILLDIMMPGKNGYEVMKELRSDKKTRKIPVFMLTGVGEVVDKVVGYELGVEDYLTKPFDAEQLRDHVNSLLGGQEGVKGKA